MSSTDEQLQILVRNGQLRRGCVPGNGEGAAALIEAARLTPPQTFAPLTPELKNLLSSYIAQGLLPGVFQQDIRHFAEPEAAFFIECAEDNRWRGPKSYVEYLNRTCQDIAPATPEQLTRIAEFGQSGFLNRLSAGTRLKLTHLSANRLIWRGEMNRREGKHVSD